MRIVDENLLDEFRNKTRCEFCKRLVFTGLDPAHIFSRGAGRIDVPINLVSLCRIPCHTSSHNGGEPTREQLLRIVATRERMTVDDIIREIYRLRRMPKP